MKWIATVLVLLLGYPLRAQYRYWEADFDSLARTLPAQRSDTARLRTLVHLLDVADLTELPRRQQALPLLDSLLALDARRHYLPTAAPYRQLRAGLALWARNPPDAQALAAMQHAIRLFDEAKRPVPRLLIALAPLFDQLGRVTQRGVYYRRQLAYYRLHGATENAAACYLALGGFYRHKGDYNQSISCLLRAADLFRRFDRQHYLNEIMVAGAAYADWGNPQRALHYLRHAVALEDSLRVGGIKRFFTVEAISKLHLRQGHHPEALRYAELGLAAAQQDTANRPLLIAYGLVQKSAVLLKLHRPEEAAPLLRRAQQLADSLRLPLTGRPGEFELDAAWAEYHTARRNYPLAEVYWLKAYRRATAARLDVLLPRYLQQLSRFYDARGRYAEAQRFARAYLTLADTLEARQSTFRVAQYEGERVEQAQSAQIANLRQAQAVQALRLQQRSRLLAGALLVVVLVSGLGTFIYRQLQVNRRTLAQLRQTQHQLVQSEKWAFVGELSAGIAHELQNPLNFMKNFADVSAKLMDDMHHDHAGSPAQRPALEQEILAGLRQNLQEISQHGIRASSIIRDMLTHARTGTAERQPTDLNQLAEEQLRLAYHGLQAQDATFQATLVSQLDPHLPPVPAVAQDLGRVLLNLCTNALHAVRQRQQTSPPGYQPTLTVSTRLGPNGRAEIRVRDNGTGMPEHVRTRIFEPFFTTKPAGEGTGLGLSLSHDIIVKGHGGSISVESQEGEGTEFVVTLPGK